MQQEHSSRGIRNAVLLALILATLLVPLAQDVFVLKTHVPPLHGSFETEKDTALSADAWFSAGYQEQKDRFIQQSFGLHDYYVRLISQVNFAAFRKAGAKFVVVGKENYLFETAYLDAYFGRDFIGKEKIRRFVWKLRRIQDTLEAQGKTLMVVLAPGKATFYPEYIPDSHRTPHKLSNYIYLSLLARNARINLLDFNAHFRDMRYKSRYPLYPQLGIHWSNYGSLQAFDSIVRFAESRLRYDLPDLVLDSVVVSDSLRHTDNDVIEGMNLLQNPPTFSMAYPYYHVENDTTRHRRPDLLLVGDSFWWYIYSTRLPEKVFRQNNFWYYNEAMYPESFGSPLYVTETDYFSRIRKADVVVLLYSEAMLSRFGDGFIDMCYETLCRPGHKKEKLQRMKAVIRNIDKWYRQVVEKAGERKISVDSMLTLDALYTLEEQGY